MTDIVALAPIVLPTTVTMPGVTLRTVHALAPITWQPTVGRASLWVGEGPPSLIVGSAPRDEYLDSLTGTLYRLN